MSGFFRYGAAPRPPSTLVEIWATEMGNSGSPLRIQTKDSHSPVPLLLEISTCQLLTRGAREDLARGGAFESGGGCRSSPRECPAQEMAHAYGSPLGRAGSDEECVFWSSVPNWRTLRTRRRPRGCWQPAKRRGPSLGISWLSVPLMLRRDFTNSRFQQIRFVAAGELWGK